MPNTHSTTIASSSIDKILSGQCIFYLILLVKWSDRLVKGMFQYRLAFLNDINPLSITSMASSKSLVLQLPFGRIIYLVTFADRGHGCDSS